MLNIPCFFSSISWINSFGKWAFSAKSWKSNSSLTADTCKTPVSILLKLSDINFWKSISVLIRIGKKRTFVFGKITWMDRNHSITGSTLFIPLSYNLYKNNWFFCFSLIVSFKSSASSLFFDFFRANLAVISIIVFSSASVCLSNSGSKPFFVKIINHSSYTCFESKEKPYS